MDGYAHALKRCRRCAGADGGRCELGWGSQLAARGPTLAAGPLEGQRWWQARVRGFSFPAVSPSTEQGASQLETAAALLRSRILDQNADALDGASPLRGGRGMAPIRARVAGVLLGLALVLDPRLLGVDAAAATIPPRRWRRCEN
jgi:hypothetical protein